MFAATVWSFEAKCSEPFYEIISIDRA